MPPTDLDSIAAVIHRSPMTFFLARQQLDLGIRKGDERQDLNGIDAARSQLCPSLTAPAQDDA